MTLLLIDANSIVYRAFYGIGDDPGFRSDGLPTGAVSGFSSRLWNMIREHMRDHQISHAAAVFDYPAPNWRHKIYSDYKGHRPATPEDLVMQLQIARRIVPYFGLKVVEQRGYEADDLIATYARINEESGDGETVVASVDKDLLMLVRPGLVVFNPMEINWYIEEDVKKKIGVPPRLVADYLALRGDDSDNVPGVKGVGKKGAAKLLMEHGSLEAVLAAAPDFKQPALRRNLMEGAETARMCRRIVALDDRVPLRVPLEELFVYPPNVPALLSAFKSLEIVQFARGVAKGFNLRADDAPRCADMDELTADLMEWKST